MKEVSQLTLRTALGMLLESKSLEKRDLHFIIRKENGFQICQWRLKSNEDFRRQMAIIRMEAEKMMSQYMDCEVINDDLYTNDTEFPDMYILLVKV